MSQLLRCSGIWRLGPNIAQAIKPSSGTGQKTQKHRKRPKSIQEDPKASKTQKHRGKFKSIVSRRSIDRRPSIGRVRGASQKPEVHAVTADKRQFLPAMHAIPRAGRRRAAAPIRAHAALQGQVHIRLSGTIARREHWRSCLEHGHDNTVQTITQSRRCPGHDIPSRTR